MSKGLQASRRVKSLLIALLVISAIPKINVITLASPKDPPGRFIDLYTQKVPFSGKGVNQSSDAFEPQELVMLYALATYNDAPVAQRPVGFQVSGPSNSFLNITIAGSSLTNQDGIAEFSFRIPWPNTNPEEQVFGTWFAIATVSIADQTVIDTLTFQVGWIIKITNIQTLNSSAQPQTQFLRNQTIIFNITVDNIALTQKTATITIDAQDAANHPIIHTQEQNLTFQPGTTYLTVQGQTPADATIGQASVQAAAYKMPPGNGGALYSPAVSATFEIITRHVVITAVKPSSTRVASGQTINITVTVKNLGNTTETFNVTAYYDKTPIAKKLVTDLEPQTEATLIIPWNTTNVPAGKYVISSVADTVPGEIETTGKTYVDGTVTILAPSLHIMMLHTRIFFVLTLLSVFVSCFALFLILGYQRRLRKKKRPVGSFGLIPHQDARLKHST